MPSKSVTIPAASSSKPTSPKKKDKNKNNTLGAYYYDSLSKEKTENSCGVNSKPFSIGSENDLYLLSVAK